MKKKYLFLHFFFISSLTISLGQKSADFNLKVTPSINLGMHYLNNGVEANYNPKLGIGLGLQFINKWKSKLAYGAEVNLSRAKSEISGYNYEFGHNSPNFNAILYETKGSLYIDEIELQLPLLLRKYIGKENSLYFDFGVSYARLIINNDKSELTRTQFFKKPFDYYLSEEDRLEEPIIKTISYGGFYNNNNGIRYLFGLGGSVVLHKSFKMDVNIRFTNSINKIFNYNRNPNFRNLEMRIELPILTKNKKY